MCNACTLLNLRFLLFLFTQYPIPAVSLLYIAGDIFSVLQTLSSFWSENHVCVSSFLLGRLSHCHIYTCVYRIVICSNKILSLVRWYINLSIIYHWVYLSFFFFLGNLKEWVSNCHGRGMQSRWREPAEIWKSYKTKQKNK